MALYDEIAAFYDPWSRSVTEDVSFYVEEALASGGAVVELAAFKGKPDLSCYSKPEALALHRDIQRSETLSGTIAPRFATAVICGFVEATAATCWQYSPAARAYVEVGGWRT